MAVRTVHTITAASARVTGERFEIPGSGFVVLGRPPLLGTVTFDDYDTASGIPLSRGLRISQEFKSFTIAHPYAEGGIFRFAVLQGDDWIEPVEPAEAIQWFGTIQLAATAPNQPLVHLRNRTRPAYSLKGKLRLIRVQSVELCSVPRSSVVGALPWASVAAFFQVGVSTDAQIQQLTSSGIPGSSDTRKPIAALDEFSSQGSLEFSTDQAMYPPGASQLLREFTIPTDGLIQPLTIPVNAVLVPGAALWVVRTFTLDDTVAVNVTYNFTEEPFN